MRDELLDWPEKANQAPDRARPLHALVRRVAWQMRAANFLTGVAFVVVAAGGVFALATTTDLVDPLTNWGRYVACAALATTIVATTAKRVVKPQCQRLGSGRVARRIEAAIPGMYGRLVGSVELTLPAKSAAREPAPSPAFLNRLIDETLARLDHVPIAQIIDAANLKRWLVRMMAVVAVVACVYAAFGGRFLTSALRVLEPWRDLPPDTGVAFAVQPCDATIARGDACEIVVAASTGHPESVDVEIVRAGETPVLRRAELIGENQWSLRLAAVDSPFHYRILGGRTWTRTYRIDIAERPRIAGLEATIDYPSYMGLPSKRADAQAVDIVAPVGSSIGLEAVVENQTSAGKIVLLESVPKTISNDDRMPRLWFSERLPGDAETMGPWQWHEDEIGRTHGSTLRAGRSIHGFDTKLHAFAVSRNDWLFAEAILADVARTPRSIALQFRVGERFDIGCHWGEAPIGVANSRRIGNLPTKPGLQRLEFSAAALGLAGQSIAGIRFVADGAIKFRAFGAIDPPTRVVESLQPFQSIEMQPCGHANWNARFVLPKSLRYRVELTDAAGRTNQSSLPFVATALVDAVPTVRLDGDLTDAAKATSAEPQFAVAADDDFGLAQLRFAWWPAESKETDATTRPAGAAKAEAERVWFTDRLPDGAVRSGEWRWETIGAGAAHFHTAAGNLATHDFSNAIAPFRILPGDRLFAEILIPRDFKPQTLMLAFHDGRDWEHRVFWGDDRIGLGRPRTASRRKAGPLPGLDEWTRIEVAAAALGLEGKSLRGMAFMSWGGTFKTRRVGAAAGNVGKESESVMANAPAPAHARRIPLLQFANPVASFRKTGSLPIEAFQLPNVTTIDCLVEAVDRKGQIGHSETRRFRVGRPETDAKSAGPLELLAQAIQEAATQLADAARLQARIAENLAAVVKADQPTNWKSKLDELSRLQLANRQRLEKLREQLADATKRAAAQRNLPKDLTRPLEAMVDAPLDDARTTMEQLARAFEAKSKAAKPSSLDDEAAVERELRKKLHDAQSRLASLAKATRDAQGKPSEALAQMRQAIEKQSIDRAANELAELRDFASGMVDALDRAAAPESAPTERHALLEKARQLLDAPEPLEGKPERFRPKIAEQPKANRQLAKVQANSPSDKVNSPAKPEADVNDPNTQQFAARSAADSLAADADAAGELSNRVTRAQAAGAAGQAALRQLASEPAMQRAMAMVDRMRAMRMESMAQTSGKANSKTQPGKVGKQSRTRQIGNEANRTGETIAGTAMDASGALDFAARSALMKLAPKLREQILEGMREQGPEAWRPLIREYFERLARESERSPPSN